MKCVVRLDKLAGFAVLAVVVGCSGSAVIDDPGGTIGGSGNDAGASATAGRAGVGGSGVGGSGVGGTGIGGTGSGGDAGSPSAGKGGGAGVAGSGGVCVNGTRKMADCNWCDCMGGQWVCTAIACPTTKACGGFLGNTCSATEYCAYMPGQACGAADASSTCQPRPDGCTEIYMPVCGCDQKTYASTCDAAAHGQGVYTEGVCPARP